MISDSKKMLHSIKQKTLIYPVFCVGMLINAVEFLLKAKKNEREQGLYFPGTLW